MVDESSSQNPAHTSETDPFPPSVNTHVAVSMELDRLAAAVALVGFEVDGVAVLWATAGVDDGVQDGGEFGVKGAFVLLVDVAAGDVGEGLDLFDDAVGVVVCIVSLDEFGAVVILVVRWGGGTVVVGGVVVVFLV